MTEAEAVESPEELARALEIVSNLSLDLEDVQITMEYLLNKAAYMEENDQVIEIYKRLCFGVIRSVENDKKCAKRFIPNFITAVQMLPNHDKVIETINSTLVSLPMILQSRWDLLTMLASSRMVTHLDEVLFAEVMACAPDQDLSARCSSTVLHMATSPVAYERAARIIFRGLISPISAVRNNVHRSWLCRIINIKNSQNCVEKILDLCREEVLNDDSKMWPVAFREVNGLTCVDLEWKAVLEEEPFDKLTFSLLAYYAVLIALKHSSSQVKVKLTDDDKVVGKGIEYFVAVAAKQAFTVCAKYKLCPPNLEKAILFETSSGRNIDIFDIVDDPMIKRFSKEGQTIYTKEKLKYRMAMLKFAEAAQKPHAKFYPAEDDGNLKVEINMRSELNAMKTLDRFLKVQGAEEYPSVAAVMETLSSQNIDERLYSQKIAVMMDIVYAQYTARKYSRKITSEFLFTTITKVPLRAVVDNAGELIRKECRADMMFREKIFRMSIDLLKESDENARPLSLVHCFTSTAHLEKSKVTEIWETVKGLKKGEKKRKMSEMLAKVVSHSDITVEHEVLHDMVICSLGLHPERFDIESTQLFVASISNILNFRSETERIMLFQAIYDHPKIVELIDEILSHSAGDFSKAAFQMVLYLFTRFHIGDLQFYPEAHLRIISRIIQFCHWTIRKFANEPMILGIAVDAICGYMPWEYVREQALSGKSPETDDPVEKLICQNLRHHRYWVLLSEHEKTEDVLTVEDFEKLPFADLIVEIYKNQDKDQATRDKLASKLRVKVNKSHGFEDIHANSLAFGMLADKALELIAECENEAEWKKKYRGFVDALIDTGTGFQHSSETDLRMANSWLGKALGKMQLLTEKMFGSN